MLSNTETSLLNISYERSGPADGPVVFLLHGWPDDIRTWDAILPALHAAGWQTIVPYLRGFGPTVFLSHDTMRSGQIAAFAADLLEFADALAVPRFALIGHDWGAHTAYTVSCLAPEKVSHCITLSVPWGSNDPLELSEEELQMDWYQWFFSTPLAKQRLLKDRQAFTRYIWQIWITGLRDWSKYFETSSKAFNNPDWLAVTLHSYRVRWELEKKDPYYAQIEQQLASDRTISVPVLVLRGESDPVVAPASFDGKESLFNNTYQLRIISNSGHFPQRENPAAVSEAIVNFLA